MEHTTCPLCEAGPYPRKLWDVSYFPEEVRVSLRLMDVEEICPACWGKHVETLDAHTLSEIAQSLMDDLVSVQMSLDELEEESSKKEERMSEEIEELQGALEDVKSRINEIMR